MSSRKPAVAVLLCIAAALVAGPYAVRTTARAGDADTAVARSLVDSGRDAFAKKRYDEALALFEKALAERPDYGDAAYWQGQTFEKIGRPSDALAAYRVFLEIHAARSEPSREDAALAAKVEKLVEKLAAAERELDALNARFVERVLAFAEARVETDPRLAREAVDTALRVAPESEAALALRDTLGGGADEGGEAGLGTPPAGPFARFALEPWHDLIAKKSMGTSFARYEDGAMLVDTQGGSVSKCVDRIRTGPRFVYEADFRVLEVHADTWLVGLAFAHDGQHFYAAFTQAPQAVLTRNDLGGGLQELDHHPMKPLALNRWHRLALRVDGAKLSVWLDGEVVLNVTVDDPNDLQGELGIFQQRCKAQYRLLRAAVMK